MVRLNYVKPVGTRNATPELASRRRAQNIARLVPCQQEKLAFAEADTVVRCCGKSVD